MDTLTPVHLDPAIRSEVGRLYHYLGLCFLLRVHCKITKAFHVNSVTILTLSEIHMHFIYNIPTTDIKRIGNYVLLHELLRTILVTFKVVKHFHNGWHDLQLFYTFPEKRRQTVSDTKFWTLGLLL